MTPAEIQNWKELKGQLVKVDWKDSGSDWPYFFVRNVNARKGMVQLQGADYPDGSAKHDGDVFWAMAHEVQRFSAVRPNA